MTSDLIVFDTCARDALFGAIAGYTFRMNSVIAADVANAATR
jgi:hypothetical protein